MTRVELVGGIGQRGNLSATYPAGHLTLTETSVRIHGLWYDTSWSRDQLVGLAVGRWFLGRRVYVVGVDHERSALYFVTFSRSVIERAAAAAGWLIVE